MTSVCVLHFKYNPYGTEHRDKPEAKAESQFVCVCLAVCVCPRQSLRRSRRERRRLRRFIRLRLCEQQAMSVVSTPVLCGDVYRGGRRLLLAAIATPSPSPPCRTWCDCEGNTNTWATKCGYTASCAAAGCSACFVPQPSPPPTSPPPCTPCTDEPEPYMVSHDLLCTRWTWAYTHRCGTYPEWQAQKYCQASCYRAGNGYDGDYCCPQPPAAPPPQRAPLAPLSATVKWGPPSDFAPENYNFLLGTASWSSLEAPGLVLDGTTRPDSGSSYTGNKDSRFPWLHAHSGRGPTSRLYVYLGVFSVAQGSRYRVVGYQASCYASCQFEGSDSWISDGNLKSGNVEIGILRRCIGAHTMQLYAGGWGGGCYFDDLKFTFSPPSPPPPPPQGSRSASALAA